MSVIQFNIISLQCIRRFFNKSYVVSNSLLVARDEESMYCNKEVILVAAVVLTIALQ